jgi:hypothetical protein
MKPVNKRVGQRRVMPHLSQRERKVFIVTSESFSPFAVRAVIDQMRALTRKWRASADEWNIRSRDLQDGKLRGHFEGSAAQAAYCADQIDALADHLLHALAEPQMQENKEDLTRVEPTAIASSRSLTADGEPAAVTAAERTKKCRHCAEEIRLIDGAWLDRETYSICGFSKRKHQPEAR